MLAICNLDYLISISYYHQKHTGRHLQDMYCYVSARLTSHLFMVSTICVLEHSISFKGSKRRPSHIGDKTATKSQK